MKITITGTTLAVAAPYHPDFPSPAKKLGGKWEPSTKTWTFDARDEERVRALCVRIYGTDGSPVAEADLLTIRAPAGVCDQRGHGKFADRPMSYWLAGREVARAFGRDSGATLGDGVVVLAGGFYSGGSVKNPACYANDDTVFELRDVPRAAATKVHGEYHGVTLLDAQGNVVAEATVELPVVPAPVLPVEEVASLAGIELDRSLEQAQVELDIAAAEGRLAGLRFRRAELALREEAA